ncbi:hypothetical protein NKR19_g3940 [Coniochaeta hoffmannii]|uniref:Uncharacterized protein n=1 Tax=Coniochaeta hoffmannii TaxID=91930 RepID=A0AA38VXM8_9PEZI|nr:hypothetical protein NKR19_g3940 [Coniochaeta hoffmannii]
MASRGYYDGDDDDYRPQHRSSSRRSRDYSPDYHSGGSHMSGAIPPPHIVPYDGVTPFYPPPHNPGGNALQVPYSPARPRSQPPLYRDRDRSRSRSRDRRGRRDRDRGRDSDSEDDRPRRERPRSPLDQARHIVQNTFSDSTSGLGVGVMGAIIGGLAAREATEAATRKGGKGGRSRRGSDNSNNQGAALLSTIVGAAVGGLGANALEKRIEDSKNKAKDEQGRWEKKWGKKGGGVGDGRERSRERARERRERERALDMEEGRAGGWRRDYDYDSEPDYVHDRPMRRRSVQEMRYRS